MTKMQIIAKSVLTVLGIYASLTLCSYYPAFRINTKFGLSGSLNILSFCIFTISAALILYFLVFNNNRLSRKIAGPGEALDPQQQRIFTIKALRIGLPFLGLMMLPAALQFILSLPYLIHSAFINIMEGKNSTSPSGLSTAKKYRIIYELLKVLLIFYLIFGASYFIRWQAKRSLSTIPDSERTENE